MICEILPLLLRPPVLGMKNRVRKTFRYHREVGRTAILSSFLLGLMWATYRGAVWVLLKLNENPELVKLAASDPLGVFLFFLSAMVLISGTILAYDAFFQAGDLELILGAPVQRPRIFLGRYLQVFIAASWMPAILLVPVLAAFGTAYGAHSSYLIKLLVIMPPYFIVPAALAVIVATLVAFCIPGNRSREMVYLAFFVFGIGLVIAARSLSSTWSSLHGANYLLHIVRIISRPAIDWLPSNWTALAIEEALEINQSPVIGLYTGLSYAVALTSLAAAALLFELLHWRAFNQARGTGSRTVRPGIFSRLLAMLRIVLGVDSARWAVARKEFSLLTRELTHGIQLIMLCTVASVYLYNLRVFLGARSIVMDTEGWYLRFLFVGNFSIGAFVTIAACTRLVFPSLSLEGRSVWVLETAPIDIAEVLKVKFWCWFVPIGLVSLVLFGVGSLAVGAPLAVSLALAFASLAVAYGVVRSATGLGAVYARFDWDHPSQLAAGFGSLLFMLYGLALVFCTTIPCWMMLFTGPSATLTQGTPSLKALLWVIVHVGATVAINHFGSKFAYQWGLRELRIRDGLQE